MNPEQTSEHSEYLRVRKELESYITSLDRSLPRATVVAQAVRRRLQKVLDGAA